MGSIALPLDSFECTPKIDFTKSLDTSILKGQNVIVTGGASGIGAACVTALAEGGAYVNILDIKQEDGAELAKTLTNKGLHAQFIQTDCASFNSQLSAFKAAILFSPTETLDIVITCAGINGQSILHYFSAPKGSNGDPQAPDTRVINVNYTGVYYSTHLALHYFRATSDGNSNRRSTPSKQLIFVGSLASYVLLPYSTQYQSAKFGVRGMWKSIRFDKSILGDSAPPFRTNLIAPTFTSTNMTQVLEERLVELGIRMATADDCVQGMMRIVCDEGICGRALATAVDGRSFDLCDDWEGADGGRELQARIADGTIGGFTNLAKLMNKKQMMA